ncbi:MAG TPA: hypothetical protein VK140_11145, partial [Ktedonobacteraceae bacterium]|nr:hypothetical protein [Ktedonobacteraceae bacterium]
CNWGAGRNGNRWKHQVEQAPTRTAENPLVGCSVLWCEYASPLVDQTRLPATDQSKGLAATADVPHECCWVSTDPCEATELRPGLQNW